MRVKLNNRGQQIMGMPFQLIFAIFLIVVFVIMAFIAVSFFLDLGKASNVGLFYKELQEAVDESWSGQSSESDFRVDLPSKINRICFANLTAKITGSQTDYQMIKNYDIYEANTFLLPPEYAEDMEWKLIEHLNITKMTATSNPYCVDVSEGLVIKKGFYDKSVLIE
jgi:hypothetical protein